MARDRILFGLALRLGSVLAFATMNALVKLAEAGGARLGEVLFFRQGCALVPVLGWVIAGPGLASLRTERFAGHLLRTAIGLASMGFIFWTILLLPLAESITLQFTLPIFATILGAAVLGERVGATRWAAVAAGFAGVVIVAAPGSGRVPLVGLGSGLVGALLSATVSILLRRLGRTEAATTIVFWFSALSVPPLAIALWFAAAPHPPLTWLWLVAVGLMGGVAQLLMTESLRQAPVSVVTPMDYSGLLWATLFGWALFGVLPGRSTWLGAPIIIGSGLVIVWREHRRRQILTREAIAD